MRSLININVLPQIEGATENRSVGGSIPPLGTNNFNNLAGPQSGQLDIFLLELDKFVRFLLPSGSNFLTIACMWGDRSAVSE
jgi:hypothetical protein